MPTHQNGQIQTATAYGGVPKGLSQDRLSKAADVSYNSIIKLETGGITNPTIETLQKIAKALEVPVDDLLK